MSARSPALAPTPKETPISEPQTTVADASQPIPSVRTSQARTRKKAPPKYTRLSHDEERVIVDLLALETPLTKIAAAVQRSYSTVWEFAQSLTDNTKTARLKLRNAMPQLVERFVKEAKPAELLEVFDNEGVSERKHHDTGRGTQVNIVVGMPESPAGPDPFQSLSPISVQQLAQESTG